MADARLFDKVRKSWVSALPEEEVRQRWLRLMIEELRYPKELIVVERTIASLPHLLGVRGLPRRRIDILCFANEIHPKYPLHPLIMIECKEKKVTQKAIDQVIGYNAYVKASFIGIATENEIRIRFFDGTESKYAFMSYLPRYEELVKYANRS